MNLRRINLIGQCVHMHMLLGVAPPPGSQTSATGGVPRFSQALLPGRAKAGQLSVGRSMTVTIKGQPGSARQQAPRDRQQTGHPLTVLLASGNRHDVTQLIGLSNAIPRVGSAGGRVTGRAGCSPTATTTSTAASSGPAASRRRSPARTHPTAPVWAGPAGSSSGPSHGYTSAAAPFRLTSGRRLVVCASTCLRGSCKGTASGMYWQPASAQRVGTAGRKRATPAHGRRTRPAAAS